jgi:hypothetical protein
MAAEEERTFDFAISYAGEDRAVAERLANLLDARGFRVFYDKWAQVRLLGENFRLEASWIFGVGTRFFVPLISRHYAEKDYPQFEWDIAVREKRRRDSSFILPLRLDDTLLLGLPASVRYLDLRKVSLQEAAEVLADKCAAKPRRAAGPYCLVATFGLVVDDLLEHEALPEGVPRQYPLLCDWLEEDLLSRLSRTSISNVQKTEASSREGECLSVRVSFEWDPDSGPLNFGALDWWETLEVAPFEDIYPSQ